MRRQIVLGATALVSLTAACVSTGVNRPGAGSWLIERDAGAFMTTLGSDTIAFESFVLQGNTLDVEAVTRSPQTRTWQLRLNWD